MTLPTVVRTWDIQACTRIPFVSLLGTTQAYLLGMKNKLKAKGYTVKGSASAGTGAMDGVDRWTVAGDVTPRAASKTASQAWFVLTDGNGIDICLAWYGNTDDVFSISVSMTGAYAAAGTPNQHPTAADRQFITGPDCFNGEQTMIGSTASGDRIYSIWVSGDKKAFRYGIASGGVWVGQLGGVESMLPTVDASVIFTPPAWAFSMPKSGGWGSLGNNTALGVSRTVIASVAKLMLTNLSGEAFGGIFTHFGGIKTELQGGLGYPMIPFSVYSDTAGARGKLGNLIDLWTGRADGTQADGDLYGNHQFIQVGQAVWPWDGTTDPVMT